MFSVLVGYLIGSIPFSYILAWRWGHIDLRTSGSRNVGAANVFRTSGPVLGIWALILDIAKGAAVVLIARRSGADSAIAVAAGIAAVIGHVYPVWLRFRGGKGVATACGVFALFLPTVTGMLVLVFVATVWWTRYVSLGSVTAGLLLVPAAYLWNAPRAVLTGAVITAAIIVARHRSNLVRIWTGGERRIGPEQI